MTRPLYICLGRAGDCINILPLLKHESEKKEAIGLPFVMTTSPFHEVFEGVSYVETIIYNGHPADITGAVEAAKKLSTDVRVVQVAGPESEIKKHSFTKAQTDSWAKEQYRLAGHYELFKEHLPLVFDKRDAARELALMPDEMIAKKPIILVATGGVSSPFKYRKLLMKLLELRFKRPWVIVDIGKIKAHRLYDLVGLLERAKFLVATDSAVLHLARAVPSLPVVALVNDRPGLWNGSPWRPEHIWTCRYSDFPVRCPSMLDAIDKTYHGGLAYVPRAVRTGRSLVHVFSAYEGINDQARESWQKEYDANKETWIHTPAFFGLFGRDSRFGGVIGEKSRYPFVKDVIRIASARAANSSDIIVLSRDDTCFSTDITKSIIDSKVPFFSHRATKDKDGNLTHHPAVDLFAFSKEFWQQHVSEFPDMIMGRDFYWQRCLRQLILQHGGQEVPFLTYQAQEEK